MMTDKKRQKKFTIYPDATVDKWWQTTDPGVRSKKVIEYIKRGIESECENKVDMIALQQQIQSLESRIKELETRKPQG